MGKLDQHIAPPLPDLSHDGPELECPECGHDSKETLDVFDRIANIIRVRLGKTAKFKKPICHWEPMAMSDYCGCKNAFHA